MGDLTVIIAAPFLFEDPEKVKRGLLEAAKAHSLPEPFHLADRAPRPPEVEGSSVVFTDHPMRLGRNVRDIIRWITAVAERRIAVIVPGILRIVPEETGYESQIEVLRTIDRLPGLLKSNHIRQGLALARARGIALGRRRLSEEQVQRALNAYREAGSVRGAERRLKAQGLTVSRTAIHRLVQDRKRGSRG